MGEKKAGKRNISRSVGRHHSKMGSISRFAFPHPGAFQATPGIPDNRLRLPHVVVVLFGKY